ncbi:MULTISPECIES: DUF1697 domain-containing protein [Winogradskyella]|uniref:DUF1697 domain-containing protein n=1 Tax=Winogradskyella TaxID=286104 RepID=UPI0015C92E2A|nr:MULTISPECIES: DUF1697 domain-containing protein [Winogradskyella]QXP77555.1 DUF1697 domain-containing protein [Winogradskyella sp. HaHa_3_26]
MQNYIALLRGVNVGGHRKISMQELKTLLSKSGLENVQTYIQSGNVIFKTIDEDKRVLENKIQNLILTHFGFEIPVLVLLRSELEIIFNNCPFSDAKKEHSYFVILSDISNEKLIKEASEKRYIDDDYKIMNNCIYLFCSKGYGKSKFNLSYFEKKLDVNATARNYKTMVKLLSLSNI